MKSIMSVAAAATFAVMASAGLSKAAPQPIRRGSLDLSAPYIPPAQRRPSREEKLVIASRKQLAEQKRVRKAEQLRRLVSKGALSGCSTL